MTAANRTETHAMPRHHRLKSLLVVAIAVGFAACGQDDGPFAPMGQVTVQDAATVTINGVELLLAPSSSGEMARFGKKAGGSKKGGGNNKCATYDRRLINNNGGILRVCGAQLEIHSGSFPHTEHLWMNTGDKRDDGLWSYEFGPSNNTFAPTPATLTIEVKAKDLKKLGIDPDRLSIAFVSSPSHSNWEVLGVDYDSETQTISAPIRHFSRYALCIE